MGRERRFKIDVFTPETLPMERLAEYMLQFAKLLGEPEHVHFIDVNAGSAVLRARVEEVVLSKVERRLSEALRGQGDVVALKALQSLDDLLAEDNAVGQLLDDGGAEIIAFPGRNRPKPLEYGPFREDGVLEGMIIKIGGKGASVPIWLQDGETVYKNCTARRPLARKLAKHYDAGLLRVSGSGSWMRLATGAWLMRSFEIKDFEVLDDAPLAEVIRRLHGVEGSDWGDDPLSDLARLRTGEGVN
ncbi:MAG: hypothetical protein CTY20_05730 [Hyphomicrobium sp.]|nr:MAG: hypothetical protein CTY20_05730 [Hyphomicrobium sp.]